MHWCCDGLPRHGVSWGIENRVLQLLLQGTAWALSEGAALHEASSRVTGALRMVIFSLEILQSKLVNQLTFWKTEYSASQDQR
jgi:hypothetical protein